jgi:trk system potassium uptake protein TrkH
MGIIVLALVILPALGIGGMQLYKREVSGPSAEKLTPRIRDTARALWSVYALLTLAQAIALVLAGMPVFDAINHALTTLSTAGFSTRDGSIGAYNSAAIEWIIIFFMMAAGTNYFLHYRAMFRRGQQLNYFRDPEWRWYAFGTVVAALVMAGYLIVERDYEPFRALTKGTFQVVSVLTTTGYGSDDFGQWGPFPMMLLFALMITGGCAGSTSGGVKWVRIVLMMKFIRMEVLRLIHPRLVVHAKFGHARVTPDILGNVFAFIFLYMTTLGVTTLLLTLDGNSILTAMGSAASALGNVGPGFDATGPSTTFAGLSDFSKWVLTLAMMMGRLELMTVFALFMPHTWRV